MEYDAETIETVARVSAMMQGRRASFNTHQFYRKSMLDTAEEFLRRMNDLGYHLVRETDEG